MQKLKQYFQCRRLYADELKQKQAITDALLNKILFSKRLLVDHVEALEQCMRHLQVPQTPTIDEVDARPKNGIGDNKRCSTSNTRKAENELFTTRNTCLLLGSTLVGCFITPRSLRLALLPSVLLASGFGAMYVVKNVFVFRNKFVERELTQLIRTIDEFGNCIRRNMTYFQEIIIMKQQELIESRQIERAWDCITAAKEVTEILYDATRKLEADYSLPAKYSHYYAPMEELRECEYFKNNVTDYSPKHIKDFHNIFAYVQSQFLLRLALTITMKPSISQLNEELVKIDCLIRQLVLEEENHFTNLAVDMNKKKQLELEELNAAKVVQQRSGPIAVLQNSSLKLSACMVAVAGECQALDVTLQRLTQTETAHKDNTKQLVAVANNMRAIENALSNCFDDFQRLMLVYNKFLNSKMDNGTGTPSEKDDTPKSELSSEFPESILRVEIHPNEPQQRDDFYAYMYDEHVAAQEEDNKASAQPTPEMEILNFERRITKGKFKPVLKQLKDRIDPIRQVMLEKEREVLQSKGINVDELFCGRTDEQQDLAKHLDNRFADKEKASSSSTIAKKVNFSHAVDGDAVDADEQSDDSFGSADLEFEKRSKKLKERDNFAEMRNFLAQKQAINLFKLEEATALAFPKMTGDEDLLESEC